MHSQFLKKLGMGVLSTCLALPALAEDSAQSSFLSDYTFSFFGTAGYSISDKRYAYTGIDKTGTFDSVSRIGAQLDAQITPYFGFTLQGELLPANNKDKRWRPQLNWASLTYRPRDNWLLRLGRMRLPALLYTQNSNVGLSYVQARLPYEVYSLSPTFDFNGLSSSYSWDFGDGLQSLTWDIYAGMSNTWQRIWSRMGVPGSNAFVKRANFKPRRMDVVGTFLTWEDFEYNNILRSGFHLVRVKDRENLGFMKEPFALSPIAGVNVYPPVGGNRIDAVKFLLYGVLGDWHIGKGVYFTGELANRVAMNMTSGLDTTAFYVQLRKQFGKLTPYVYWAWSQSSKKAKDYFRRMNKPTGIFQYDVLNGISADTMLMANQNTLALGASYDIGTNHRLKVEYARVHIAGDSSSWVDVPAYESVLHKNINIFTASYNFLF